MKQNTLSTTLNLVTRQWDITENNILLSSILVEFGFTSDESPIVFNNLSFGIIVQQSDTIVYYKAYPKVGVKYINTDQAVLEKILIDLEPLTTYKITFWAEDSNLRSENIYTLITPDVEVYPNYEVV